MSTRQMTDHTLDVLKGWLPGNMGSLDKSAKLSANVTVDPVYAGRVGHLNSEGEFELGATGTQMPIFFTQNSDDTDVNNPNTGGDDFAAITSRGTMSGVVATGGYEIETTEFDSAQTYAVNDIVRAVASNSNATTGGRITNASFTLFTNAGVGVVSKAVYQNCHRKNVLRLWTAYIPGLSGQ
jgi:hypothetical protein